MTRPTFILELRAEPGVDSVRTLRAVLKRLLRNYGLRAVSVFPSNGEATNTENDSCRKEKL
jgi:hypothetical protein